MDTEEETQKIKKIHTKHGAVSANRLLARAPDAEYLDEWTRLLAREQEDMKERHEASILVFKIGKEWFGILAKYSLEVCEERPIHRIPHKLNPSLKGLINLKGQLRLCVNLHHLLEVELEASKNEEDVLTYNRLLSIQKDGQVWTFPVDEVYGIHRVEVGEIENVPVTVSKSTANFLRGVVPWKGTTISYLDEELLFSSLERSVI